MDDVAFMDEFPYFGDNRGVGDVLFRTINGALPLAVYGLVGEVVMQYAALEYVLHQLDDPGDRRSRHTSGAQAQIPLMFGFTMDTPWSSPQQFYEAGKAGQPQGLQLSAFMAGQRGAQQIPIRSHTTGLLDYGVRNFRDPFSIAAMEVVHPGRSQALLNETRAIRVHESVPSLDMKSNFHDFINDIRLSHLPDVYGPELRVAILFYGIADMASRRRRKYKRRRR